MIFLFAATVSALPIPMELGPSWAEYSEAHWAPNSKIEVEVGTLGLDQHKQVLEFWMRRTVTRRLGREVTVTWTDTRRCPAARTTLASMRNIPVPKFAPIGTSEGPPIVLDGPTYKLHTYSDEGSLTAVANTDEASLARWIKSSLSALDHCWDNVVPRRMR